MNEELAVRIQNGERCLIADLWQQNIGLLTIKAFRLYDSYRERCASSGVELDDIVQVCYFALCDAVQAFQVDGEYKFTAYIKYPLLKHFRALVGIRSSKRDPLNQSASLNETIGEDETAERIDFIADPESNEPFETAVDDLFQSELRDALEAAISKLPNNRATVVRGRYFENKTQGDIAAELGVSNARVGQFEHDGLRKLRRERSLQSFHDEILSNLAYKRTGFAVFRDTWESSVEHAVLTCEEILGRRGLAVRDA
jgi:RNA polymerase sigma factor (sigma-70 family)